MSLPKALSASRGLIEERLELGEEQHKITLDELTSSAAVRLIGEALNTSHGLIGKK
jgi:hypothetical protein